MKQSKKENLKQLKSLKNPIRQTVKNRWISKQINYRKRGSKVYWIIRKNIFRRDRRNWLWGRHNTRHYFESRVKNKRKNWKRRKKQYRTKITEAFIHFCQITHQKRQKRWQEQEQYCGGDLQTLTLT